MTEMGEETIVLKEENKTGSLFKEIRYKSPIHIHLLETAVDQKMNFSPVAEDFDLFEPIFVGLRAYEKDSVKKKSAGLKLQQSQSVKWIK
ncbi:hypothetical protein AKJ52_02090 [candidate division MSBL1 archaeon SCGC-AAA382C18]|uniref:Uncharacterized protein n=1 Tax=candidate division MSBL1 archaeon SCGC-AAA382C18 TaxID=1698281 RepID=A0A133VJA7_9EURY|nr:hypothetical protein AKJ52_02090 [candidate division MSBL1 archaeon SCGC-AAA382C18]